MMSRLNPETNEKLHQRFAQHIGPPCHGVAQFCSMFNLERLKLNNGSKLNTLHFNPHPEPNRKSYVIKVYPRFKGFDGIWHHICYK